MSASTSGCRTTWPNADLQLAVTTVRCDKRCLFDKVSAGVLFRCRMRYKDNVALNAFRQSLKMPIFGACLSSAFPPGPRSSLTAPSSMTGKCAGRIDTMTMRTDNRLLLVAIAASVVLALMVTAHWWW
jgi:hypothetical protein